MCCPGSEVGGAAAQLGVNLVALVLGGVARLSVQRRVYKVRLKRRSNDSIHTDWRERIERGGRTRRGACPHVHRPKRAVGGLGKDRNCDGVQYGVQSESK